MTTRPTIQDAAKKVVKSQLPVFWLTGPPYCGKSTLAQQLGKACKYHVIKISTLVKMEASRGKIKGGFVRDCLYKNHPIPDNIIIALINEEFNITNTSAIGYILDGFPLHVEQAKLFEKTICKPTLVICISLKLDAILARMISLNGDVDLNLVRINHLRCMKQLNQIKKRYTGKCIDAKSMYPPEETCKNLLEILDFFWGYKFQRMPSS